MQASARKQAHSVAIIGTRGYPNYYGGFETAVRFLAPALAEDGWTVTVYGRRGGSDLTRGVGDPRIRVVETWGIDSKALSTLTYGLSAAVHAFFAKPDVAIVMNVANGFWLPLLRFRGIPTLLNVDGLEWTRDKWGRSAKAVFRAGARMSAKWATRLIADSKHIASFWKTNFARDSMFIPYGAMERPALPLPDGLEHRRYILLVARFVEENTISPFLEAAESLAADHDVVVVGSSGYGSELDSKVAALAARSPRVTWLGHVADDDRLHALWQHCGAYFHGHSVGGTNPALVQAMLLGAPTVARDTVYNREVLGETLFGFVKPEAASIRVGIAEILRDREKQEAEAVRAQARARVDYSWAGVAASYSRAALDLLESSRQR
ncbi:DUF1972 domain-containing protein [Curtobacterium sp. RHCKG23]|uniref:DUF1972 domain-containing protein n=1 Tax=Curtobacterium citri TaxID=3055139 RepID=A0ABT7T9E3_9MICO|nr:DUF1972 domain-containing protein [Curtobacterium citri]MDM7886173.1 DUF1972 domain-containing protein [Curtobacterium citri]